MLPGAAFFVRRQIAECCSVSDQREAEVIVRGNWRFRSIRYHGKAVRIIKIVEYPTGSAGESSLSTAPTKNGCPID